MTAAPDSVLWECEDCGESYREHPLEMAPHRCDACRLEAEAEGAEDEDVNEDWGLG